MSVPLELLAYRPLVGFQEIKNVLERIGVPNTKDGRRDLYTSVISVTNPNTKENYLLHFKQALQLEGKPVSEWKAEDQARLHNIAHLLTNWNLIEPLHSLQEYDTMVKCRILTRQEQSEWNIIKKYSVNYTKIHRLFPQQ